MATSAISQPPPPILTTSAAAKAATVSPTSPTDDSQGSSTITPSRLSSTTSPITTESLSKPSDSTPFSPFPPTPDYDDVESPSLSSGNALARFEFERRDSNDIRDVGTKVLMVEWEEDSSTTPVSGEWTVGWDGKSVAASVPTMAQTWVEGKQGQLHRLYFLLPQWARVPGTVVLTLTGSYDKVPEGSQTSDTTVKVVWRTHPLPAIYPAALGNSARASGKRGVLHTVWAKKRLQVLASEIRTEELHNPESISLDLAIQERDWIEKNFGVKTKPMEIEATTTENGNHSPITRGDVGLGSPTSPKSPGRGPLSEKLKGLKLVTGQDDLNSNQAPQQTADIGTDKAALKEHNPLSPEVADVAVSWTSFANLHSGMSTSQMRDALGSKPAQQQQQQQPLTQSKQPSTKPHPQPGMHMIAPPDSVLEQQRQRSDDVAGIGSLNAFAAPSASSSEVRFRQVGPASTSAATMSSTVSRDLSEIARNGTKAEDAATSQANEEEDLFALPLSPRSPDRGGVKKFTFEREDTARYVPGS